MDFGMVEVPFGMDFWLNLKYFYPEFGWGVRMTINPQIFAEAVESCLDGVLAGTPWPDLLDTLAAAAGADGAVLARSQSPTASDAILACRSTAGAVKDYLSGDHPADSRVGRVKTRLANGFRTDHDDFSAEEIAHDPYYQDFLRPRGFQWHMCGCLQEGSDGPVDLSFKRGSGRAAFAPEDVEVVDKFLPALRRIVRIAGTLGYQSSCDALVAAARRGRSAWLLDARGYVIEGNSTAKAVRQPLSVKSQRLVSALSGEQGILNAAVKRACVPSGQMACVSVRNDKLRQTVYFIPLRSKSPTVFNRASAIVIVGADTRTVEIPADTSRAIAAAFGLTASESRVACLVASGLELPQVAQRMSIAIGTVRNHLKLVFQKLDCHRQMDVVMLFQQFDSLQ